MKPWHFFAAAGAAVLFLIWALDAGKGDPTPPPYVPYTLVVLPILVVTGIVLTILKARRRP